VLQNVALNGNDGKRQDVHREVLAPGNPPKGSDWLGKRN
jgi:hypothetical protein